MIRKKGRGTQQIAVWQINEDKIKKELTRARDGLRKFELNKKTRLSRPTIDKHLSNLTIKEDKVKRIGRLFFWKSDYEMEKYTDLVVQAAKMIEFERQRSPNSRYDRFEIGHDLVSIDKQTKQSLVVHWWSE